MAEYRTVRMGFWNDPYIESLSPEHKLLYLYLFTCPHTNNLGILEVSANRISFESGLPAAAVSSGLDRFEADGKLLRDGLKLWLTRFIKHQTTTSEKLIQGLRRLIPEIGSKSICTAVCERYPHLFDTHSDAPIPSDTVSIPPGELEVGIGILKLEGEGKGITPLTPHGGESASKPKRERKTPCANSLPFAEEFATFWESYPRRVAKPNAEKAWAKLVKAGQLPDMDTLLAAVANQAEANDWAREDGRFCPHPATWLNGRRWEDTPGIAKATPPADFRKYRSWAESYATKRAALIGGTAETTSDVLDSGAKVLAEYITPDGFSEDEAGRIIAWILSKPERAAHVSALANLADEVPGWGMLITWASNGSRGVEVGDDPHGWRKAANG